MKFKVIIFVKLIIVVKLKVNISKTNEFSLENLSE